jgi:hypothetical protein
MAIVSLDFGISQPSAFAAWKSDDLFRDGGANFGDMPI